MLLQSTKIHKLPETYWKILYAAPAFDNSLCFMGMKAFREDCLTFINADGKLIKEITFE